MANDKQWWLRNEQGRVWGPYVGEALERLRGQVTERWSASTDGREFKPLPEFPELKQYVVPSREVRRVSQPIPVQQASADDEPQPISKASLLEELAARLGSSPLPGQAESAPPAPTPSAPQPPPPVEKPLTLPEEGSLAEVSPVRLYAVAALTNANGWLQFEMESGRMLVLSVRRGAPEHLSSDDPDLSLARFLQKSGTITAAQGLQAEENASKSGVDIVTSLFQLQLIPPADAHRLLGEYAFFLLDRVLITWRGKFSFEADAPSPPGAFPLGQKWQLLAQAMRRLEVAPLRARLGKRLLRPVQRSGGLGVGKVEELALTAQEARLYAAIDGVKTGEELLKANDPSATLRLLYLLTELGHLSFAGDAIESKPEQQAVPRPASQPPKPNAEPVPTVHAATPVTPSQPMQTTQPKVTRQAPTEAPRRPPPVMASAPHTTPTHGVPKVSAPPKPEPQAPHPQVSVPPPPPQPTPPPRVSPPAQKSAPSTPKVAPARPQASAQPTMTPTAQPAASYAAAPPNETPEALLIRMQALLLKIEKANHFEALGLTRAATAGDVKRTFVLLARDLHPDTVTDGNSPLRQLKERLFSRVNEASGVLQDEKRRKEYEEELDGKSANVDVARIFAAEEAFQKGEIMIKARKYKEGLALVEEAITLNDQEAEFYAWRGWAKFLISTDRKKEVVQSVADCKKAISMIPVCVPAHLFIAQMSKAMGDLKVAEQYFKKVLELDPKHVDAQRELRLMGAAKK
ncbi:MAG: DnaJ domain-containing protein [Deltaproteobacteria bacterium]|nr:DnaJ domain-containing protein [Deltaproteobacteria bacterium]